MGGAALGEQDIAAVPVSDRPQVSLRFISWILIMSRSSHWTTKAIRNFLDNWAVSFPHENEVEVRWW